MKILQIVSVISPDNVYGGPTTVALNHCRALRALGHDVLLAAGAMDFVGELPTEVGGVPVRLFPARRILPGAGFAGVTAPGLLRWLPAALAGADAVHVHLARDLLTLPAAALALRSGTRVALQTHGMIDPSGNPLAAPLDALLTRRVLRGADRVFYLTEVEAKGLRAVAGQDLRVEELRNGIGGLPAVPERAAGDEVEILYLARLQERKRPMVFVAAARELAARHPGVRFRMVGPDEGQGPEVAAAIADSGLGERLRWDGPATSEQSRSAMERADVYVLPSVNEPYPMSVLEAMGAGLPVVLTDTCGLAPAVARADAGTVVGHDPAELTAAIERYLLDPGLRLATGRRAARLVEDEFSMRPVADQLVAAYEGSPR